jgi:hypothetical protein
MARLYSAIAITCDTYPTGLHYQIHGPAIAFSGIMAANERINDQNVNFKRLNGLSDSVNPWYVYRCAPMFGRGESAKRDAVGNARERRVGSLWLHRRGQSANRDAFVGDQSATAGASGLSAHFTASVCSGLHCRHLNSVRPFSAMTAFILFLQCEHRVVSILDLRFCRQPGHGTKVPLASLSEEIRGDRHAGCYRTSDANLHADREPGRE